MTETNGAEPRAATAEVGEKNNGTPCAEDNCRYLLEVYSDASGGELNRWIFDSRPVQNQDEDLGLAWVSGQLEGQPQQVYFNIRFVHSWALIPAHGSTKSTP